MRLLLTLLLMCGTQAMAADAVTVKSSSPLASMMSEPLRISAAADGTYVNAKGSFYVPNATDNQMLPNIVEIDCWKNMEMCIVSTVNLIPDSFKIPGTPGYHISTILAYHEIVEWTDAVVRARDNSPKCAFIDYVIFPKAEAARLEKQAKTRDEACSDSTYTAHLGFVLWEGK